ncbi:hypothetical protein IA938_07745 [Listeria welshimeri]|nr:hypothetical protein [Listeria welshimeri]MBC1620817.1 hypothetical protein [Listeria welshimeri]MBC2064991.1 hypothetical protein [Listeria welshimeri]MBF2566553.1 hypothetical protein [Listeria welshimeri]
MISIVAEGVLQALDDLTVIGVADDALVSGLATLVLSLLSGIGKNPDCAS